MATTAVVTVAGIVTACSSVPDVTFSDDDAGSSVPDGGNGFDTSPAKDAISGDGNVADAPTDAPACTPTNGGVEDCDDGIDNDCNGKVDCADSACTPTHACINTPPVGWSLVAESDATRPACPADYPTAKDIDVVPGTGSGTCGCSCAPTVAGEACNLQQSKVTISGQNACNDPGNDLVQDVSAAKAACTALTASMLVPNGQAYGKSAGPAVPPTGCSATVTNNAPAITAGRACSATTTSLGGGCGVGKVCARKAPTGLALCVQKSGSSVCPGTYGVRKSAGTGGSGTTTDNRTCNACSCNQPACTATVTLYENIDCVGGKNTGPLPAACSVPAEKNFTALAYKSTVTGTGCGVGTFNANTGGAIAFTDPTTICCP